MRRGPSLVFIPFLSCVLGALASAEAPAALAAARVPESYRVLAGSSSRKDIEAGRSTPVARAAIGQLTISVEFLEPVARAAFVRSIAPAMTDPFALPGRPDMYTVFKDLFDNRSGTDVQFQPQNVVMYTDRKTQDYPV